MHRDTEELTKIDLLLMAKAEEKKDESMLRLQDFENQVVVPQKNKIKTTLMPTFSKVHLQFFRWLQFENIFQKHTILHTKTLFWVWAFRQNMLSRYEQLRRSFISTAFDILRKDNSKTNVFIKSNNNDLFLSLFKIATTENYWVFPLYRMNWQL